MLNISDLNLGFLDASQYDRRKYKDFFNKIFMIDDVLYRVVQPNIYFLIGEKGTGKTAYAVFLHNSDFDNTRTFLICPDSDSYTKIFRICNKNNIGSTEFKYVWKSLIYLLFLNNIKKFINTGSMQLSKIERYERLMNNTGKVSESLFNEDVNFTLGLIENIDYLVKDIQYNHENYNLYKGINNDFLEKNLLLQKECEEILSSLKLRRNFILFVDSYDIRPDSTTAISYETFISCLKGLCTSIIETNRFLADIRGLEDKYTKVVLSLRPDVLIRMDIQNLNERIQDNSVILNWSTSYQDYRSSRIFLLVDKLLSSQQEETNKLGETWDYYFPYKVFNSRKQVAENSFINFLRFSWYRPRDIIKIMKIMKQRAEVDKSKLFYTQEDFENSLYDFSNFLLGEVCDEISFYYGQKEKDIFLKIFNDLDCRRLSYKTYLECFRNFSNSLDEYKTQSPLFMDDANEFLQFLYEHNIIGYEVTYDGGKKRTQWFFTELGPTNIRPKVRIGENVIYNIHHSISKALNIDFSKSQI